jgi:hypothetical protein
MMTSSGSLFLLDGDHLISLAERPYDAEDVLQALLAKHPDLLPGEAMDPADPRRFLLIRREVPVVGLELDHLFLDQDAVPLFVETKRASNRETRRLVVAQMLDYAANASAQWSAPDLAAWLSERCTAESADRDALLTELDHNFEDEVAFWAQAEENLRAGKIRLVFVSDDVPPELQRIVEFLNERMTPTEVLAVEVRQYLSDSGKQLLQPQLVGQTDRAREIKGQSRQRPVINTLVESGHLADGGDLWLLRNALPTPIRPQQDDDPRLRFALKVTDGQCRLVYRPGTGEAEELLASKAPDRVRRELDPDFTGDRARAVNDAFSREPGGETLGALAVKESLWDAP